MYLSIYLLWGGSEWVCLSGLGVGGLDRELTNGHTDIQWKLQVTQSCKKLVSTGMG